MADDWKQKYLANLDRQERAEAAWQATETLLRQGLTRVALAAQGVDERLDRELDLLRQAIRSGTDVGQLERVIEGVADAVVRLDEQRSQQVASNPQALLVHWLDSLSLPRELRSRAKTLRHHFAEADDIRQMEQPLYELAELVNSALKPETGGGGGLIKRLFGSQGGTKASDREPGREDAGQQVLTNADPLLGEFCIQLLDTLSLPAALTEQVESLKERLAGGLAEHAIAPALHAIADLISTMRRQMEAENHELQDFLRQLTGRLQDLDQYLAGAKTHHRASVDSSRELDAVVQAQVRHIESSVDQAEDPQQLKAEIQQRLETILRHLDEHRESDEARQQQLEEQLERLNQRVREMEKEGESLRQRLREKHEQAVRDPLTGLYNRLAYDERIVQEFARAKRYKQPLSLAVLDIDRFKRINDSYGHKAGDKALKIIADRVRNNLRETDFLARYGGEEFVIVMPETGLSDGLVAVEKLRKDVSQSQFHYQGTGVAITVSVGLAEMREDDNPETLFQRADRALYKAKDGGRDRTCVEES